MMEWVRMRDWRVVIMVVAGHVKRMHKRGECMKREMVERVVEIGWERREGNWGIPKASSSSGISDFACAILNVCICASNPIIVLNPSKVSSTLISFPSSSS